MTDPIDVFVVGPSTRCDVVRAVPDYRMWNQLVGGPDGPGSISTLPLPEDLRAAGFNGYCDDDAIARGQAQNHYAVHLGHYVLRGPVILFRDTGDGDEHSLSTDDVRYLASYLSGDPSPWALARALGNKQFWEEHPSGHAVYELNDDLTIGREIT